MQLKSADAGLLVVCSMQQRRDPGLRKCSWTGHKDPDPCPCARSAQEQRHWNHPSVPLPSLVAQLMPAFTAEFMIHHDMIAT